MPLTDNFDSYTDGDLNTQGTWSASSTYDIQGVLVKAGAKAVHINIAAQDDFAEKSFTATTNDTQKFFFRVEQTNKSVAIVFKDGASISAFFIQFRSDASLRLEAGSSVTLDASYDLGTWYEIDVSWRSSDSKCRARVDGGAWTAWTAPFSGWTSIDRIRISNSSSGNTSGYFDEFSDGAPVTDTGNMLFMFP